MNARIKGNKIQITKSVYEPNAHQLVGGGSIGRSRTVFIGSFPHDEKKPTIYVPNDFCEEHKLTDSDVASIEKKLAEIAILCNAKVLKQTFHDADETLAALETASRKDASSARFNMRLEFFTEENVTNLFKRIRAIERNLRKAGFKKSDFTKGLQNK